MNDATTSAAILGGQAGAVALTTSQTYTFNGAGQVQVWLIGGGGAGGDGIKGGGGSGTLVKTSAFDVSVGSTLNVAIGGGGGSSGTDGGATTVSGVVSASAAGGGSNLLGFGGSGGSGGGGSGNSGYGGAGGTNGGHGMAGATRASGHGQGPWTSMLSDLGEDPYGIQAGAGGSEGHHCVGHQGDSPCCDNCGGGGGGGLYFSVESPVGGVTVSNPSVSTSHYQATSGQGFGAGGAGGGYSHTDGVGHAPHTDGADGLVYMMFIS